MSFVDYYLVKIQPSHLSPVARVQRLELPRLDVLVRLQQPPAVVGLVHGSPGVRLVDPGVLLRYKIPLSGPTEGLRLADCLLG